MSINTLQASHKYLCKSQSSARHTPLLQITSSATQPDELPEVAVDKETTKALPGGTTAEHIFKILDVSVSSSFPHTHEVTSCPFLRYHCALFYKSQPKTLLQGLHEAAEVD